MSFKVEDGPRDDDMSVAKSPPSEIMWTALVCHGRMTGRTESFPMVELWPVTVRVHQTRLCARNAAVPRTISRMTAHSAADEFVPTQGGLWPRRDRSRASNAALGYSSDRTSAGQGARHG